MDYLEAAMAFAVAMVIFSTIATGVVELIVRVCAFRERVLRKTLESLYATIILPWVRAKRAELEAANAAADAKALAAAPTDDPAQFVSRMLANPTHKHWIDHRWQGSLAHSSRIDALTTIAFAERLARTDVGRLVLQEVKAGSDLVLTDLCRSFERFGRASSEVFRKWAQVTSICVGVAVAFAVNIDAGRLVGAMLNDPELRTTLIQQAEAAREASEAAEASLSKVQAMGEADQLSQDQVEEIKAATAGLLAEVSAAQALGLPVGWRYFPYCQTDQPATTGGYVSCGAWDDASGWDKVLAVARWLALTTVAGVLIGLGGPFWFKVFSSLSQVAQLLRAVGLGSGKPSRAEDAPRLAAMDETAKPPNVAAAFRVAAEVYDRTADYLSARPVADVQKPTVDGQ